MGRFKDESTDRYKEIKQWLVSRGYKEGSGPKGEKGYYRTYPIGESEVIWVTFDFENMKIYLYKEYVCGGCLLDTDIRIEREWLEALDTFIDIVDEELSFWID